MNEVSENLVRRMYEEAWNQGKLEVMDDLCGLYFRHVLSGNVLADRDI